MKKEKRIEIGRAAPMELTQHPPEARRILRKCGEWPKRKRPAWVACQDDIVWAAHVAGDGRVDMDALAAYLGFSPTDCDTQAPSLGVLEEWLRAGGTMAPEWEGRFTYQGAEVRLLCLDPSTLGLARWSVHLKRGGQFVELFKRWDSPAGRYFMAVNGLEFRLGKMASYSLRTALDQAILILNTLEA